MSEWKEEILDNLVVVDPEQLSISTDENFAFFYIDIGSVSEGHIDYPVFQIKYKGSPSRARKTLKLNDVLMSTVRPNLKSFAKFNRESKFNFVASTGFAILRAKQETDIDFVYHNLFSEKVERQIQTLVVGSNYPAINSSDVRKLIFDVPDYQTQRKIARILSTADAVIEKTQAAIAKYKAIKQGMLHDLFTRGIDTKTGKLRPKYEDAPHLYKKSKLGWIPKEWEVVRLEESEIEIIDGDRGVNYPKENDLNDSGYCLFLSATNVTKDGFKFEAKQFISKEKDEILGTGRLRREDIIVTTRGTVGNVAFYEKNIPYNHIRINSGMIILRNLGSKIQNQFLFHYLKDYLFKILYQKSLSGSAQPQLPIKDLKKFFIIYSKGKEQKEISNRLKSINNKIQTEQTYLHKLQQIKAGLMADLLSGKKEVVVEEETVN